MFPTQMYDRTLGLLRASYTKTAVRYSRITMDCPEFRIRSAVHAVETRVTKNYLSPQSMTGAHGNFSCNPDQYWNSGVCSQATPQRVGTRGANDQY